MMAVGTSTEHPVRCVARSQFEELAEKRGGDYKALLDSETAWSGSKEEPEVVTYR